MSNNRDQLSLLQRGVEFIPMTITLGLGGFLLYHHIADTGFFTDEFGFIEAVCIYIPLLLSLAPPLTRAITGHRNPARPVEASVNVIQMLAAIYLLIVFPFDYAHLADALPNGLRFLLSWITDDIAKVVWVLIIFGNLISAIAQTWQFVTFPYKLKAEHF